MRSRGVDGAIVRSVTTAERGGAGAVGRGRAGRACVRVGRRRRQLQIDGAGCLEQAQAWRTVREPGGGGGVAGKQDAGGRVTAVGG